MLARRQRGRWVLALVIFGTCFGAASGYWLGRWTLGRLASAALAGYATDLLRRAEQYSDEVGKVFDTLEASHLPFCSDEELTQMRAMTFRSLGLSDIGRMRGGQLYCSAFLGRLAVPLPAAPPTVEIAGGVAVTTATPLLLSGDNTGTVVSTSFANVVLNPTSYEHWDRPGATYMIAVYGGSPVRMVTIAGRNFPLSPAWILAQKEQAISGSLMAARCSRVYNVCAVAERLEPWAEPLGLLYSFTALGTLAGLGLGLAIGQFYNRRTSLPQQLRRALRGNALQLVYQPIVDLHTRRWVGAEALVRWTDEDDNPIPPDVFVGMAEEQGWIGELTAFVVSQSTHEMRKLLLLNPHFRLSINIAAPDLDGEALFTLLDRSVRRSGIPPHQIALELTERTTADTEIAQPAITRLRSLGYHVHIDDFGTGFSSLSYLHELSVDAIKVDRTFTSTIDTEAVIASVLPQILDMAHTLHATVIVEGIESEAQIRFLLARNEPFLAQGWYFSRPVGSERLYELLEQNCSRTEEPADAESEITAEPPAALKPTF